jgi:hypothetical protein
MRAKRILVRRPTCLIVPNRVNHNTVTGTLLTRAACPLAVLRHPLDRPQAPSVLPVTTGGRNRDVVCPPTLPPITVPLLSAPRIGTGIQHFVNAYIRLHPLLLPRLLPLDAMGMGMAIITRDPLIAKPIPPTFALLVLTLAQSQVCSTEIMNVWILPLSSKHAGVVHRLEAVEIVLLFLVRGTLDANRGTALVSLSGSCNKTLTCCHSLHLCWRFRACPRWSILRFPQLAYLTLSPGR